MERILLEGTACYAINNILGTQWNEFYWKEQTVMLLMQEQDFSNGKNPDFCSR